MFDSVSPLFKTSTHDSDTCEPSNARHRSRMGCFTCRKRKKRCDEGKPVCKACERLKLECSYPVPGQERRNRRRSGVISTDSSVNELKKPARARKTGTQATENKKKLRLKYINYTVLPVSSSSSSLPSLSTGNGFKLAMHKEPQESGIGRKFLKPINEFSPTAKTVEQNPDSAAYGVPSPGSTCSPSENPIIPDDLTDQVSVPQVDSQHSHHQHHDSLIQGLFGSPSPEQFNPSLVFSKGLHGLISPGPSSRILEIDEENDDVDDSPSIISTAASDDFNRNSMSPIFDPSILEAHLFSNGHGSSHAGSLCNQETSAITPLIMNDQSFYYNSPLLMSQLTPWYALQLDKTGISMFEYYSSYLANIICVSSSNSFLDVFIPLAQADSAVLYALVAYASFHQNKTDVGSKYLNKSIELIRRELPNHKMTTLAGILLVATAEICNGDMINWQKLLETAAEVIKMNGGLRRFTTNRTTRWLATNFFYHEILGASKYSGKTHFQPEEYDEVLRHDPGVHSLIGCCKSIFYLMAQLSELAAEAQTVYDNFDTSQFRRLYERARDLEIQIDNCQPDSADIANLSSKDQEQQLTLFETFQLTAKLQLQQSVLRRNASSLNLQIIGADLIESLDVVLNTRVEGSIVFPLFMASIIATKEETRQKMMERFDGFYNRNLARNILRAKMLAQEVWSLDCYGTKYVNWYDLIKANGFDICFA